MGDKRHNINTIAEVLIDKLGDMERVAKQIEKASNKSVSVDTTVLNELLSATIEEQVSILKSLEKIADKNQRTLPNWVLGVLGGIFLLFLASGFYMISKSEKYDLSQNQARYYQEQFEACKSSQKER